MAYNMIRVCPRRTFNGTGLTASTGTMTITVAERIDISQAIEVDLYARLHSTSLSASNTVTVKLVEDYFDSNDPGTIWIVAGTQAFITLTAFDSTSTAPTAQKGSSSTVNPRFAAVQVLLTRGGAGANLTVDLSIDITLKINNGTYMPAPNTFAGYRY